MEKILQILNANFMYLVLGMAVLIVILMILVIYFIAKCVGMQRAYKDFMEGRNGKSLEAVLREITEDNKKVKVQCKHNIDAIIEMKKGLKATYKKIGLMKYDTFRGMSGKLSFSLALLDGENSGFVLSCMHTQDGCYSYLKEIIHGESHVVLSNEESDALNMALNYNVDQVVLEEKK